MLWMWITIYTPADTWYQTYPSDSSNFNSNFISSHSSFHILLHLPLPELIIPGDRCNLYWVLLRWNLALYLKNQVASLLRSWPYKCLLCLLPYTLLLVRKRLPVWGCWRLLLVDHDTGYPFQKSLHQYLMFSDTLQRAEERKAQMRSQNSHTGVQLSLKELFSFP